LAITSHKNWATAPRTGLGYPPEGPFVASVGNTRRLPAPRTDKVADQFVPNRGRTPSMLYQE
jgi:hypothetical protein